MPEYRITTDDGIEVREHVVTAQDEAGAKARGRGFRRAHVTKVELISEIEQGADEDDIDAPPEYPEMPDQQERRLWPFFSGRDVER